MSRDRSGIRSLSLARWQPGTDPAALSEMLFGGALVELAGVAGVARLIDRVRGIIEDVFGTADPERYEQDHAGTEFLARSARARRAVTADADVAACWRTIFDAIGYAEEDLYVDRIRLRIVPSQVGPGGRAIRPLPAHRDTWASGIAAQINWWLPLYPLCATRTMVVWPEAFSRPVANDSDSWSYEAAVTDDTSPLLPAATERPAGRALPVLVEPGSMLAFSGAHLHASAADHSGRSRFSVDTRSVWVRDVLAGRGASNIDCHADTAHWDWFANQADPGSMRLAQASSMTGRSA